ncbi:phosphatidylinositol-4-phosphate 5 kinase-like protein [Phytophthora sojae]|uniref:Phosphatidylinositol-4-phosphate 5 kinase-like protein n=1 Tax=Phytophthora sojae (strain P6497) TaxID=1094619 RepID=G4YZL0_PHYSP|nr:phosphatidylinositol-4-phosphate 5 kinase-like protein [Phytophthora sojae]EGZ25778.1 phosphatidylinositol-4-phosphate 5 kinase-like protein [Phytophthora sojae]|eukprot:XP_009521066.1 phosphatidylinositol-4-phosphate 5 kinase-like protein [Phytophthora sojae]
MPLEVVLPTGPHNVADNNDAVPELLPPVKVSPDRRRPRSPSSHDSRPASPTFIEIDGMGTSSSIITSSATSIATSASTALDMSAVSVADTTSPQDVTAGKALARVNARANLSILDKRMRIGKKKKGGYKNVERSFKPPAGNVINLQHEQYALTYGMMCGIRDSAGLQKPFKQRLTMDDFMLVDKKIFPANSQLQHPFKFKDYSPDVFRQVRRRFGIDLADYMLTLSGDFNFIEFMSNSKSGQFFFYSHDGRFMIKTQTKDESKFLRRILPHYYKFVMENPDTLITRFYGMHRVKMHHLRRKMHFVIMASVFDTPLEIHARFDLKGSRIGRHASPKEHERGSAGVLKDNDLLDKGFHLQMGVARRAIFLVQLRKDVEFLKRMKIMDYSLLIGVHDSGCELHDDLYTGSPASASPESVTPPTETELNISQSLPVSPSSVESDVSMDLQQTRPARSASVPDDGIKLQMPSALSASIQTRLALSPPNTPTWSDGYVDPDLDSDNDSETSSDGGFGISFGNTFGDFSSPANRSSIGSLPSTPKGSGSTMAPLSPRLLDTAAYAEYSESVFCKDEGGIYGRDRHGRKNGFVYFLGIIDILQQYNTRKIAENIIKGMRHNRKQISAVNPEFYGDRFIEFVEKHVVQDDTLFSPRPRTSPSSTAHTDNLSRMEEEITSTVA